jgi:hypothetical protein
MPSHWTTAQPFPFVEIYRVVGSIAYPRLGRQLWSANVSPLFSG